ncbi:winged helix-turn-helix transcriptional regulator [Planctomycetales bacterium ZRK34]|nr:winged helix-turn-helix transcriptional regulator [Planctomycetales bacterium ZRK34]
MARPYRQRTDELDVFRALGHPVRRKIVMAALDDARSFSQLQQLTHRSNATLAAHLRILREARIITATRSGLSVYYRVNRKALRTDARWLADVAELVPAAS